MSSFTNFASIAARVGAALSTSFGDAVSGWMSKGVDVGPYITVSFEYTYTPNGNASTLLTFKTKLAGRTDRDDLTKYYDSLQMDPSGQMVPEELPIPLTGSAQSGVFRGDVRAASMMALSAKLDAAGGTPTLAIRYLPDADFPPDVDPPEVT